ncbi:MAG: tRNA (adenosine(37)-N6)-threonylcarbamoyltransferase complex dimerization subunit type 1 TsaB [Candidatus Peribacteraceae bacterium]|jgi:tRNA threonylcarbamoyl adenosine modification protein YeaZ
MNTLFLDLAGNPGLVACVTDDAVVSLKEVDRRISDADLLPLLEALLAEARWSKEGIGRVACVTGPGGFTSLRVAAAFANALAFSLNVPVAGIHLSELCAVRVSAPTPLPPPPSGEGERGGEGKKHTNFLWLHSTKKIELFVRGFGSFAKAFPEAAWMDLGKLGDAYPSGAPWTGELLSDHERFLSSRGAVRAEMKDVKEVLPVFLKSLKYGEKNVVPWYGRKW